MSKTDPRLNLPPERQACLDSNWVKRPCLQGVKLGCKFTYIKAFNVFWLISFGVAQNLNASNFHVSDGAKGYLLSSVESPPS